MHKTLLFIALLTFSLSGFSVGTERTHYLVISGSDRKAGELTLERGVDGWTRTSFQFKENGRGPDLNEEFRLAEDASLQDYKVKGKSTFGSVVDEQFSRRGQQVEWRSPADSGKMTLAGPGFYVPQSGSYAVTSSWITALSRHKGSIPLIPSGQLRQNKLDELTLQNGARKERVQLLALEGLGFAPNFVWATTGTNPKLFAAIYPGVFRLIPEAWVSAIPQLEEKQKAAERKFLERISETLTEPLDELTVIRNARIFDSEKAELTAASDVYIKKGLITAVLPAGSATHESTTQIDANGQVLLPGLFDMHAHVSPWDGRLHLAAGVTSVRDLGNSNLTLQQTIAGIENNKLLGPQVIPAGFLEGESPYSARLGFQIKDLKEAQTAIDWYAQHGYPQLKIYNSFPKDILRETVAYAHSRGMRVSGHVPAFMKAQEVVEQGFDEIQHINQLMLNFFVKPETDTRTLDRFYLVAEQAAELNLDSKEVRDFIALLKEKGTVIDPTLAAFEFIQHRDGTAPDIYAAVMDHLPPDIQRSLRVADMKIPDEEVAARYQKSYGKMLDFVARMYRAGIPVVAGTDATAGFALHSELELYVKAGLSPAQALQIATRNGALYSRAGDRGVVASGKRADLVLVDGDPTRNIGDLRKISMVLTQGKLLRPERLYQSMGIKPFVAKIPKLTRPKPVAAVSSK